MNTAAQGLAVQVTTTTTCSVACWATAFEGEFLRQSTGEGADHRLRADSAAVVPCRDLWNLGGQSAPRTPLLALCSEFTTSLPPSPASFLPWRLMVDTVH